MVPRGEVQDVDLLFGRKTWYKCVMCSFRDGHGGGWSCRCMFVEK